MNLNEDWTQSVQFKSDSVLTALVNWMLSLSLVEARRLREHAGKRAKWIELVVNLARHAHASGNSQSLRDIHWGLMRLYEFQFNIFQASALSRDLDWLLFELKSSVEDEMLKFEQSQVDRTLCESAPRNGKELVVWLKQIINEHPAAKHPFYTDYLRCQADRHGLRYFLIQETTLDPRFDDILALLQLGTSGDLKMEIGSNYWDELGQGDASQMHTHLFSMVLQELDVTSKDVQENVTTEALRCGNLSACLSLCRPLFAQGIGYFGVTEYLAPRRFRDVVTSWHRNKLQPEGIAYHELHVSIDAVHGAGWFKRVIGPLVDKQPELAPIITEGVLLRLNSSQRFLDDLHRRVSSVSHDS